VLPASLPFPELVDYELRIPRGGSTAALTEVLITWHDDARTFRTRGVHANQVFAGINATLRMLNVLLHQGAGTPRGDRTGAEGPKAPR
jgi:D-citramalate synthase